MSIFAEHLPPVTVGTCTFLLTTCQYRPVRKVLTWDWFSLAYKKIQVNECFRTKLMKKWFQERALESIAYQYQMVLTLCPWKPLKNPWHPEIPLSDSSVTYFRCMSGQLGHIELSFIFPLDIPEICFKMSVKTHGNPMCWYLILGNMLTKNYLLSIVLRANLEAKPFHYMILYSTSKTWCSICDDQHFFIYQALWAEWGPISKIND